MAPSTRKRRPHRRPKIRVRWLAVGALVLLGLLYYQPVRSYLETREVLDRRGAEVRALAREQRVLKRRLAESRSPDALLRQARRLGLVRPGERLYIVKGIAAWRRAHSRRTKTDGDG